MKNCEVITSNWINIIVLLFEIDENNFIKGLNGDGESIITGVKDTEKTLSMLRNVAKKINGFADDIELSKD
jgi:hypothetical protein